MHKTKTGEFPLSETYEIWNGDARLMQFTYWPGPKALEALFQTYPEAYTVRVTSVRTRMKNVGEG